MSDEKIENGLTATTTTTIVKNAQRSSKKTSTDDHGMTSVAAGGVVLLPARVLNELYHNYSIKQRRSGLKWFLFAALLFVLWTVIIPTEQKTCIRVFSLCMLASYLGFVGMLHVGRNTNNTLLRKFHEYLLVLTPNIMWTTCMLHLVIYMHSMQQLHMFSARDILGWVLLLNFLIYVTLPVPLMYVGGIGFWTYVVCVGLPVYFSRDDPMLFESAAANAVLLAASALIGLGYYFMGEAKQKRAFLEAKKSLEVKMVIEEQSAEQERLLLSVLPKHVAVKMREDLGSSSSEPFKKIYMSRHENVSILYADIVGFTAISSTYSAQDLVKMLNELFARFDRLAEKYQQLRIKILGDCYYCISGISDESDERHDHAVLCVHMGLSMVKAIKYVQQKANSPVDMRVGIHTGAILAGILGQRQWQFDVYSKDVELANKMESSGKAGRVHISDKTLAFLNGEFEVEPAFGEKREELLRIAGLKTYFITKVLKPFASPCTKKINELNGTNSNSNPNQATSQDNDESDTLDEELLAETQATPTAIGQQQTPEQLKARAAGDKKAKQENFKQRLEDELVSRNGHENLTKDTTLFLKFKNKQLENAYGCYREPYSSLPLLAALLVQLIDVAYSCIVLPRSTEQLLKISAPLLPIALLVFISIAESFPACLPMFCVTLSKRFNDVTYVRELAAIIIALTIGLSNVIDMWSYVGYMHDATGVMAALEVNTSGAAALPAAAAITAALTSNIIEVVGAGVGAGEGEGASGSIADGNLFIDLDNKLEQQQQQHVLYPSYLSNFGILILIAIAVIAQLTHVTKIALLLAISVLHCYFNIFVLDDLYAYEDKLAGLPTISLRYCHSGLLLVAALALCFLTRHMDHEDRVIFKWKNEVAEQKETANDMRQRNEALVYNVLPVHVAEHFMKNTKRSHDDLYSQSYAEVGVLFASMPNFSDFYSEESVNNQGLECLRFLNEVISDFDALLELPQFQDIIKIKTIGSTYMAASGINVKRELAVDDPITKRWSHLAVLVEFALELTKTLQGINEQSFNHFVLKMGINHGPITAGVIGARKPHYDIWGNTVNVASRMESTGKAGAIQVTEETCNILEEFGYTFLQRGLVAVKGKGQLMTYYLQGKTDGKASAKRIVKQPSAGELQPPSVATLPPAVNASEPESLEADLKTPLIKLKASGECDKATEEETSKVGVTNNEQQSLLD